ncbi:MAG: hypothetical protein IJD60_09725 [Clostridia bacterium]|nr:hypothetical protein [Clostridia bacterium]
MSMVAYRCPGCGAPLAYGAQSGKLECAACGSSYALDALEVMSESPEESSVHFDMSGETFGAQEAEHMRAYVCQACGAELMTEETTTATECPYCGSPTVLPDRIEGGVKPEKVIPFTVTKEQAQKLFEDYFKGKKLLPNVFLNTRNRISEMRRVYVPYWLFDCRAGGSVRYDAQKKHTRREGEWEVTYTEHYAVSRSGMMDFRNIPVDGSVKLDNRITESLEPYDMSAAVPFAPAVLAGALADHADANSAECEKRARERVESSMEQALRNTVIGYTSVLPRAKSFRTEEASVTPVLMPVWLITTQKEGKTYTFAINGQTGKLTCDVPADTKKSLLWGAGVFAGVFALACAAFMAMGMLDEMMLLMAAILAMIASVITVGAMTAQLRQAAFAGGAGSYALSNTFELHDKRDHYLHTTQTRRRIEQKPSGGSRG